MAVTWRNERERVCLAEVYKKFATQEWFRGAGVIPNHQVTMADTLEVAVNYHPRLQYKELVALAEQHGYPLYIQEVDASGKPVNKD